ncbi:MAG: alpha/beta fold hydrolase [Pseudooceanicola sp.]
MLSAPDPRLSALEAASRRIVSGPTHRRIVWRSWGEGPPIVFLHGASGSWRHWVPQIEAFRLRRRVLAADLPGFGASDLPEGTPDIAAMARDVAAGLDSILGGAPYDLVAFSFGGGIAGEILQLQRPAPRRLVLLAPAGFGRPAVPPMRKVRGLEGDELLAAHRFNLASLMIADPARIDSTALRIQHLNSLESRLRLAGVPRPHSLTEGLPAYPGPVTLIWGTADGFMPEGRLAARQAAIRSLRPDATVHLLEGIGHWMAWEAPDRVNAILEAALADS